MKSKLTTTKRRRSKGIAVTAIPTFDHRAILARRLDQLADHNLHLGFHRTAEVLANRAAELRENAR